MNEKELAKAFFQTNIGKKVAQILVEYKQQTQTIVRMSQRINQLEEVLEKQSKEIPLNAMDEKDTVDLIDKAISLLNSPKKPEYLFSITDEEGNVRGVYTSNVDEMIKNAVEAY